MFGLLPLLFALLVAETTAKSTPLVPFTGTAGLLLAMVGSVLLWLVCGEGAARFIARTGRRRWLTRWELSAQALMLAWFAWACYGWGWSAWANDARGFGYTLSIAPWMLMQAVHWWCMTVAVRVVSGHPWSRLGLVLHQFRFGVLPMAIILPLFDVGAWIAQHWQIEAWFDGYWGALRAAYCAQLFMVVVLMLMPVVLVPLWGARRMAAGSDTERLMREGCASMGVRVAGLMRWPVPGGRVYNAAVVGLVPRLRYVLFTDDLMHDLEPQQLQAVLGHELGHARHGHLWFYFLFANAAILVSFLVDQWLPGVVRPWLGRTPDHVRPLSDADPLGALAKLLVGLAVLAVQFRLVFGYLSRACERQADLAGAELAGSPQAMSDALKSVAQLSGQPENEPSWRHYSIAQRIAFLDRVRQQPGLAVWHHQLVRTMRYSLIILIVVLFVASYLFDPRREAANAANPGAVLAAWVDHDRDLDNALKNADRGDILALSNWINRSEEGERQRLALLLAGMIAVGDGTVAGAPLEDDRVIYRYRYRLIPFVTVPTGDAAIDDELDNTLACGLSSGTDHPTEQDLKVLAILLPRLEERMKIKPRWEVLDTIGCIYFVQDNYAKAREAFTQAARLLAEDKSLNEQQRLQAQDLARRRLEAAAHNAQFNELPDATFIPLPKNWPTDNAVEAKAKSPAQADPAVAPGSTGPTAPPPPTTGAGVVP